MLSLDVLISYLCYSAVVSGGGGDYCDVSELLGCDSQGSELICEDLACCYIEGGCYHSNGRKTTEICTFQSSSWTGDEQAFYRFICFVQQLRQKDHRGRCANCSMELRKIAACWERRRWNASKILDVAGKPPLLLATLGATVRAVKRPPAILTVSTF